MELISKTEAGLARLLRVAAVPAGWRASARVRMMTRRAAQQRRLSTEPRVRPAAGHLA